MSMETDRIEDELRDSRHRLSDTLGALGNKLSPGQIVDEVMGLAQGQAGAFTANLGRQVRDNPLPAVLIAVGAALLFAKKAHRSDSHDGSEHHARAMRIENARAQTQRMADETEEAFEDRLHHAYAKALDMKQSAGEAIGDFKRRVKEMAAHAKHSAQHAGEQVSHAMSGAAHMAKEQSRHLGESVADARHKAEDLYQETPLAAGAVAIAIGAILGSAAPLSTIEREKLGKVADRAAQATGDLAKKGAGLVKDMTAPVH